MPIHEGQSGNDSSDDDAAAFAEAVSGARKLGGAIRIVPTPARDARQARPPRPTGPGAPASMRIDAAGDAFTARADGVDPRLVRKLRAGEVPVEARLDLHGLTRARADRAVAGFVAASRAARRRCLLIIHGRGLHSGDDGPALRDAVREALTIGGQAGSVLACCAAPARLGGPGATLVLLRR